MVQVSWSYFSFYCKRLSDCFRFDELFQKMKSFFNLFDIIYLVFFDKWFAKLFIPPPSLMIFRRLCVDFLIMKSKMLNDLMCMKTKNPRKNVCPTNFGLFWKILPNALPRTQHLRSCICFSSSAKDEILEICGPITASQIISMLFKFYHRFEIIDSNLKIFGAPL